MSAKRSFDVQVKRAGKPARKGKAQKRAKKAEPAPRRRKTLRAKREEARTVKNAVLFVLFLALFGVALYGLWRPEARIQRVEVAGAESGDAIAALAKAELKGTYYRIFPRDSFLFYPKEAIEHAVLDAYPSVSKVAVSRIGFDALRLSLSLRQNAFWWCGTPGEAGIRHDSCYEADGDGLIFRAADVASDDEVNPMLRVYAELSAASSSPASYPLRAHVEGTGSIPAILEFSRGLSSLSVPVRSIAIRGDEADLYTDGGTRVTYVVGKERTALQSLETTLPRMNLLDGSLEYVDVRFEGKVYIKRRSE